MFCPYSVLLIRNYSIKRTVVREGRRAGVTDTTSSKFTRTQEAEIDEWTLDDPQITDRRHEKSPSDLEMRIIAPINAITPLNKQPFLSPQPAADCKIGAVL